MQKIFVVFVVAIASVDVVNHGWNKYDNKNHGRHNFQIEPAMDLINYAIKKEWDAKSKRTCWMRQKDFVPCNCEGFYFCLNGFTTGVAHKQRKRKLVLYCKSGQNIRKKSVLK